MTKPHMKFYTSELLGYIVQTSSGVVLIDDDELYLDGADGAIFESKPLAQSVAHRVKKQWNLSWARTKSAMRVKRG